MMFLLYFLCLQNGNIFKFLKNYLYSYYRVESIILHTSYCYNIPTWISSNSSNSKLHCMWKNAVHRQHIFKAEHLKIGFINKTFYHQATEYVLTSFIRCPRKVMNSEESKMMLSLFLIKDKYFRGYVSISFLIMTKFLHNCTEYNELLKGIQGYSCSHWGHFLKCELSNIAHNWS